MVEPSNTLKEAFENAINFAKTYRHEYLTLEHLFLAMITSDDEFPLALKELGTDCAALERETKSYLLTEISPILGTDEVKPRKTIAVERVLNRAFTQALFGGRQEIDLIDVFISMMSEKKTWVNYLFQKSGIDKDKFIDFIETQYSSDANDAGESPNADQAAAKKLLQMFTTNLTEQARQKKIDPVVGRTAELEQVALCLGRKSKSNVILVGEPGVGKTAVVEGLANHIVTGNVPEFLKDYELFSLDISAMLAGAKFRGDFEDRFKQVLAALEAQGKAIMFVDEAHMMQGAGASNSSSNDLANMMKPALGKGTIKVIASTTWDEYRKHFEKDRALMRRFHRVVVDEPTTDVAIQILKGIRKYYEQHHNVKIKDDAIKAAVKLSVKYQADKKLPDKAIDLIDCACSRFNITGVAPRVVTEESIQFELSKMVNIPAEKLNEQESNNLGSLESSLKAEIFGQDDAISEVVDKILVSRAGLKSENKPVGSFVFMGSTGTGKSATALALAKQLGVKLVRFDMSEYQEKHSISKLIGSPPGYVGYEDNAGLLITKIQESPSCVLLLDEIEKAHPDVCTILLQMMDNGFVTGSNGKQADCRNVVIIITTNAGAAAAEKNTIGFTAGETQYSDAELKRFLSPEFRNRLDAIVTFKKLSKETMIKIVGKFMLEVKDQVKEKGVKIKLSSEAIDFLVEKGFDPKMGARPLHRIIDKEIKRPLARQMLFGELTKGGTVNVAVVNGALALQVKTKKEVTNDTEVTAER